LNCPKEAITAMDITSCSVKTKKCLTMATTKCEMTAWLQCSNSIFTDGLSREEFYELIK
jgi:hypothetical protein